MPHESHAGILPPRAPLSPRREQEIASPKLLSTAVKEIWRWKPCPSLTLALAQLITELLPLPKKDYCEHFGKGSSDLSF